jgi:DNA-binding transcriptional regulator YiaG
MEKSQMLNRLHQLEEDVDLLKAELEATSKQNKIMRVPLPRSYPQVLATVGDHLRKWRLDLGLLQREVAERLGVDHCTVTNWELNRTKPALRFLPGSINLLGFDPSAPGASLGERLKAWRHRAGVPQD